VGCYFDTFLERGFVYSGGFFKPIDFPGAPVTSLALCKLLEYRSLSDLMPPKRARSYNP
jgi:hypothetical protein